jgi:hypothetical protein
MNEISSGIGVSWSKLRNHKRIPMYPNCSIKWVKPGFLE